MREFFPEGCLLVGLSSIFWREAWKYGERGSHYSNHDVGHTIAAVSIAAAGLGWVVRILEGLGHEGPKEVDGASCLRGIRHPFTAARGKIPGVKSEHPDGALAVFPRGSREFRVDYRELSATIAEFPGLGWKGKPNALSKEHVCWDVIYRTAEAVEKPLSETDEFSVDLFFRQ